MNGDVCSTRADNIFFMPMLQNVPLLCNNTTQLKLHKILFSPVGMLFESVNLQITV